MNLVWCHFQFTESMCLAVLFIKNYTNLKPFRIINIIQLLLRLSRSAVVSELAVCCYDNHILKILFHKTDLWSNKVFHQLNRWVGIFADFSVSPVTYSVCCNYNLVYFLKIYHSLPLKAKHVVINEWVFATFCMAFNTLLILIVSTGEWPRFPCGRIAFGCLQLSGNCFSRLGEFPPHPLHLSGVWARPRTEPWGTPRFLWTHTANTGTRHTH